ncbi:actin cytoskeleton-regulatory complex protein pan1 [Tripterygium wilfordii]|uniref:Actin cytoskeleton-regulatory complex protein pan1 n=1 Tax=Tripterygium wilfordii TaxID=458696 RepID=A0A7J7CER5_TRIWF|nr:uncharacterized protein LOC119984380 [Tripterygium wilfordii]KAF5732377.1 actin cytoskeleton-regulatory complex protein pan1 [Tripterygium wilfordii]
MSCTADYQSNLHCRRRATPSMASRYEIELYITSANDLKNVNWRYGPLRPYAVVWVDPDKKCSSRVDEEGDTNPYWDEKLLVPLPPGPIEDHTLHIDIVHAGGKEDVKPLIGSARLNLGEFIDESGVGQKANRTLKLKRPSGRPQGKLEIKLEVRDQRYREPEYYAPPYGAGGAREYVPPPPSSYGAPYAAAPQNPYYASPAPSGYPSGGYNYGQPAYGNPSYGQESYGYGRGSYGQYGKAEEEKKSKFGGMGTGLAVGAVAGAVGAIAIAEGVDALEDNIADDVAEKVEDDYYDGGDDE